MATALSLFASFQKPLTPDRVTRYKQYRRNPITTPDSSAPEEEAIPSPARRSFLTHANSRVYPLNVLEAGRPRPQSVDTRKDRTSVVHRPPTQSAKRAPKHEASSVHGMNLSMDSAISQKQSIPRLEYRQYRRMHQQRHNNTTPARREYGDVSGEMTANKRFYQPQVVKITPRSKLVLHSSVPISISAPLYQPFGSKKSLHKEQLFAEVTYESPAKDLENSPPAITFAEKMSKLREVSQYAKK